MSLIPNSFQYPNYYNDVLDQYLTSEESKVLTRAIREIFGWEETRQTRTAQISLSTFRRGNKRTKSAGIGLSREAIITALDALHKYRILLKIGKSHNPQGQTYKLNLDEKSLDLPGLKQRLAEKDIANKRRTETARKKKQSRHVKQTSTGLSDMTSTGLSDMTSTGLSDMTSTGLSDRHTESHRKSTKEIAQQQQQQLDLSEKSAVAVVVDTINNLIRKTKKGEPISAVFLEKLCKIHQTTQEQVLICAQALATIPGIRSIPAVMLGTKNGDGHYDSSCFYGGICILAQPEEPQPEPEPQTPPRDYQQEERNLKHYIQTLDEPTRQALMQKAEAKLIDYKGQMNPEVYQETLQIAFAQTVRAYLQKEDTHAN